MSEITAGAEHSERSRCTPGVQLHRVAPRARGIPSERVTVGQIDHRQRAAVQDARDEDGPRKDASDDDAGDAGGDCHDLDATLMYFGCSLRRR